MRVFETGNILHVIKCEVPHVHAAFLAGNRIVSVFSAGTASLTACLKTKNITKLKKTTKQKRSCINTITEKKVYVKTVSFCWLKRETQVF